ncbi:MAG: AtpZ/AtpI family protein [Burkholderiaceae bacterium]|jgi:ATP synthase protein I|nr:AtpZ/AtpI family protein [Burkholderiaceae bacterium]
MSDESGSPAKPIPSRSDYGAPKQSDDRLAREVDTRVRRIRKAERDRGDLLAQSVFLGTVAGLFVVPIVGGAYLGRWLDTRLPGYSVHWTVSMIFAGVAVGAVNVYLFLRDRI